MKDCILCLKPTHGSIGAAGIYWPMICQKCKNKEDQALMSKLVAVSKLSDYVFETPARIVQ